jgi:hypothetical protein
MTDRMINYTNDAQTPKYGKLRDKDWDQGDFVFKLASLGPESGEAVFLDKCAASERAWDYVNRSTRASDLKTFINRFEGCFLADLARTRLVELLSTGSATTPSSTNLLNDKNIDTERDVSLISGLTESSIKTIKQKIREYYAYTPENKDQVVVDASSLGGGGSSVEIDDAVRITKFTDFSVIRSLGENVIEVAVEYDFDTLNGEGHGKSNFAVHIDSGVFSVIAMWYSDITKEVQTTLSTVNDTGISNWRKINRERSNLLRGFGTDSPDGGGK